jgi:hypothetical protein
MKLCKQRIANTITLLLKNDRSRTSTLEVIIIDDGSALANYPRIYLILLETVPMKKSTVSVFNILHVHKESIKRIIIYVNVYKLNDFPGGKIFIYGITFVAVNTVILHAK